MAAKMALLQRMSPCRLCKHPLFEDASLPTYGTVAERVTVFVVSNAVRDNPNPLDKSSVYN
jgi:hypothetical protein